MFRIRTACALFLAALLVAVVSAAADETNDNTAKGKGWVSLFDGKSLDGWQGREGGEPGEWVTAGETPVDGQNPRALTIKPGSGILVNGPKGRTVNLYTKDAFGDIEAHIEFMIPAGSNSGVYFQGRYEIQILDSYGVEKPKYGDCGGIYQRWAKGKGFEGHAPRVNASRKPGQWQSFDVVFRAPRFDTQGNKTANARFVKVTHNGQVIHENVEVTGPTRAAGYQDEQPTGSIMFQGDHGPVAYRNLRIRPLADKAKRGG